jgi:hypothetical protein
VNEQACRGKIKIRIHTTEPGTLIQYIIYPKLSKKRIFSKRALFHMEKIDMLKNTSIPPTPQCWAYYREMVEKQTN